MDIALEKRNNEVIFKRAVNDITKVFGELTEEDISHIMKIYFRPTWNREGWWFKKMRHQFNKTFSELSEESNIEETLLYKLERGQDFKKRDEVARCLEKFYQNRIH